MLLRNLHIDLVFKISNGANMAYNLRTLEGEMEKVLERLQEEYTKLRTGRATAALVEDIQVSYYGTQTPVKQIASISVPEASMLVIQPWDKGAMADLEAAIANSGKGLSATNDGNAVRVKIPPLTTERRNELSKLVQAQAEEAKVALRNARQTEWQSILKEVKDGKATEDDKYRAEKDLNELIRKYNEKIESLAATKTKEIETV